MSVLSSETSRPDQTQVYSGPPPTAQIVPSARHRFFDEPRNRLFAAIVGFLILALLILTVVALATRGSDDATSTANQPFGSTDGETISQVELEPASAGAGDGLSQDASEVDVNPLAADSITTEPSAIPSTETTATTETPTTTEAPTTSASSTTATSTSAPSTTATPTTAAPTTAAPTTASSTTAPPTSATSASSAPPATPAPTTTAKPTTTAVTNPPPSTAAPVTQAPVVNASAAQQILALTNSERASAGCGALVLNGNLNTAAQRHSEDMRANGYFSHTGLNGSKPWDRSGAAGYPGRTVGENIAQGYRSAEAVMTGWMNSPGHRANILNCNYKDLGVGLSSSGNYWTQLFGATR